MKKQTKSKFKINIAEKVSFVSFKDLKPNVLNENTHDKKQIKLLFNHIKKVGMRKAIIVSNDSGYMVTGHGTYEALKLFNDDMIQVPVSFQNFANEKEEFDHRVADNGLARLSILNQSQLEINANNLGIDLNSYDFSSLGLVDFKSLERQATDILQEADADTNELYKELTSSLDDSPVKKNKSFEEIEREATPPVSKKKTDSDIPDPLPAKNISKNELLNNFKTAYINVLDARLTFMQVRSRDLERFISSVDSHTHDLVAFETLLMNFVPNGGKVSLPFNSDEFLSLVGVVFAGDTDKLNYFFEPFDVIDGACPLEKIKQLHARLEDNSFYSISCPHGFGQIAKLTDYLQELIEDSFFYIPKSHNGNGFEAGYITNLGYPILTFVKGSLSEARKKLESRKIEHREKDKILKDFYAAVVNESSF